MNGQDLPTPSITSASVRVLRSHDYCHFEVSLSTSGDAPVTPGEVDNLRKAAARLADKAVEQYKIAKDNFHRLEADEVRLGHAKLQEQEILGRPETERTPEEQALVKSLADRRFRMRRYDYEDDWDGDYGDDDE